MIEANSCKKLLGAFNVLLALFHGRAGLTFEWITDYTYYFYTIVLLYITLHNDIFPEKYIHPESISAGLAVEMSQVHPNGMTSMKINSRAS